MIIPSIDIMNGRAVQLRHGRELILEGGDPLERLAEFSIAGEVAIVDLDAAMGKGSNARLIRDMVQLAPCRVGGGIRDIETALDWLDAGATRVVIGTAACVNFCSRLPRDRVVAAVDAEQGTVVVEGWKTTTTFGVIERIKELAPTVGGFLLTQVEHEGAMSGFDFDLIERACVAAGDVRVTAAGGITTAEEVRALDHLGVDAQVGMALYSGTLSLGAAIAAPLARGIDDRLWPTVVCDESGGALGLVWSTRESLQEAVSRKRGIYWSRSRNELWVKGETSGAVQQLLKVELDCDSDALRFTVQQHGSGFCHTGKTACWPDSFNFSTLDKTIGRRRDEIARSVTNESQSTDCRASGTARLLGNPALLRAKLLEEAAELAGATDRESATHEAADVIYFALVAAAAHGVGLTDIRRVLEGRQRRVRRRPMYAKSGGVPQ